MTELSLRRSSKSVFHDQEPQHVSADGKERTWVTRGGNFAVCYSEVKAGAVPEREHNPEEFMVILPPDGATAVFDAGGARIEAGSDSLTIVPPGRSRITVTSGGVMARIFSKASGDVMAL